MIHVTMPKRGQLVTIGETQRYQERCLPDHRQQAVRLEALRYKWRGYQHATRCMQWLGDLGRLIFPLRGVGR